MTRGKCYNGMTLVELLIVIVIVGALSLAAVPSYQRYIMRAHRTEAKTALLRLAANQERFYLQNNTYTTDLTALGFPLGTSENGVYTLSIPQANTTAYQATATPTPGGGANGRAMESDTECAQFAIDGQGLKTATPDSESRCW